MLYIDQLFAPWYNKWSGMTSGFPDGHNMVDSHAGITLHILDSLFIVNHFVAHMKSGKNSSEKTLFPGSLLAFAQLANHDM